MIKRTTWTMNLEALLRAALENLDENRAEGRESRIDFENAGPFGVRFIVYDQGDVDTTYEISDKRV